MKKDLPVFLLLIVSLTCFSQQTFEDGYSIDNYDQRLEIQIKTRKWRDNPNQFDYRLSKNGKVQEATIDSVKEFGLNDNSFRYIRRTVNIDRSRENLYNLSTTREPEYKEEQLFLRVLLEGKATLYLYSDGNLHRFFYSKETPEIEQLVFKKFKTPDGKTMENNEFRQQLWNDLKCSTIELNRIQNMEYKKSRLIDLFKDYNNCKSSDFVFYEEKEKSSLFHLAVRPRTNYTALSIENSSVESRNTEFGDKIGLGIGIEIETTLPFNTRKWAIFVEPIFQYFQSEQASQTNTVHGGTQIVKTDYKSIELPVGLKYYFFLNQNFRFFLSASYVLDFSLNSSVDYARYDGYVFNSLELDQGVNPAIGVGYQYTNYSLAVRYQFSRNILASYSSWNSGYQTTSLILGYTLF